MSMYTSPSSFVFGEIDARLETQILNQLSFLNVQMRGQRIEKSVFNPIFYESSIKFICSQIIFGKFGFNFRIRYKLLLKMNMKKACIICKFKSENFKLNAKS